MHLSDLTPEQQAAVEFMLAGEDALLALDVGFGKTVVALTGAKYKLEKGEVNRWLVLAPLLVATDTWAQEPAQWDHLRDLNVAIACGSEAQRREAIESNAEIVVINYENLAWLLEQYPRKSKFDPLPFDGLIADEIDKLKSVSSNRFKAFRNRIGVFNSRIGLTGSLVPNDLTELWGAVYMVDGGTSFGRSFYDWRKRYFYPIDYNQYQWRPFEGTAQKLLDKISDITFRAETHDLPRVDFVEPATMRLDPQTLAIYKKLERDLIVMLEQDDITIEAANEAVLSGKLQQITAGFSYSGTGKAREAHWHSREKFLWLQMLRSRLAGEQLLVFYHFTEELAELKRIYPDLRYLGGKVSNTRARQNIAMWNAGKINMLALHPASAGHGLNLQKSGAHHIAFLTLPWSGGMLKQVIGRLARRGQSAPVIYVHTALYDNSVDRLVYDTVIEKKNSMEQFLRALKGIAA